jgi:methyl-accepting chemotaxis protein
LRAVESSYLHSGSEADYQKLGIASKNFTIYLEKLVLSPILKELAAHALEINERYRSILLPTPPDLARRSDLPSLAQDLLTDVVGLEAPVASEKSSVQQRLTAVKDRMSKATELFGLASTLIVVARTAQAEEIQLVVLDKESAAVAMDEAAGKLSEVSETIYEKMPQDQTNEIIQKLIEKIKQYRSSIPEIVEANRVQKQLIHQLDESVDAVGGEARRIEATELERMRDGHQKAQLLLVGSVASALLLGVGLSISIGRGITRPIARLVSTMAELSQQKIDTLVEGTERRDEIGEMARAVQVFKDNAVALEQSTRDRRRLEEEAAADRQRAERERIASTQNQAVVVEAIATGLENFSNGNLTYRIKVGFPEEYRKLRDDFNASISGAMQAMRAIAASVQTIRSGTSEISGAAEDLSWRTEQQAASLVETAASLNDITRTVGKTAEGAHQASQVVSQATVEAEHSGLIVRQAVNAMNGIERSAQQIAQIIGVIDEIAFQTNLLALNAGVEAARAGEAGNGFAVVASEVRGLAQRSAEAAKEIRNLISNSTAQVGEGVGLVGQTGQALERIVTLWATINTLVSDIAASANAQASELNEVNVAVSKMDQVTQQNAAMVQQTTAASHALAEEANQLSKLIRQFKLEGEITPIDAVRIRVG